MRMQCQLTQDRSITLSPVKPLSEGPCQQLRRSCHPPPPNRTDTSQTAGVEVPPTQMPRYRAGRKDM